MLFLSATLLSLITLVNTELFPNIYPKLKLCAKPDLGDPLIITPYLEKGLTILAQNLSRVNLSDTFRIQSHAGFFTINKKYNSNLYFWYFQPVSKNGSAPVILWLQGGPGISSLVGLFAEVGPIEVLKRSLFRRKFHWAQDYHLIFIDNPVGAGFSFTENTNGYCVSSECIGKGLYQALLQFFQLFPNLKKNEFFIAGESYAGKYVASLGMAIHKGERPKINLKGMAMASAYCDPINQLDYGNFLYQHGLLDKNQLNVFLQYQMDIYVLIKNQKWLQANLLMDRLMDGQVSQFSLFKHYTGFENYYNLLQSSSIETSQARAIMHMLHRNDIRHSIHVGGRPLQDGGIVQVLLAFDMMKSVAPAISELLSHYRIMFFNGQLDIVVAYPLTVNFLRNLAFSSSEEYSTAPRNIWKVGKSVAGYIKCAGNLTEVLVRNAGHMIPKDQPKWTLNLITRFIENDFRAN